jgi:hypothetical protein
MSKGIIESNRLIVNRYQLPEKFLHLRISSGVLLSQLKMFEQSGMLWLLQRGFGLKTLRAPKDFQRKLSQIKAFVESVDASLRYFGISSAAKRKDIIYKRIDTPGMRMEFARDLERIASFYKISGLEFREEDQRKILSDINTSSRKHPFRLALGRLVKRLSIEDPDKLNGFYDSLGLPPQRRKALSMISDSRLVPRVIYMKEEPFNERFRAYHEGIDIVFTGNAGDRRQERFSFTDKAGMFDVVMGFPIETIRRRIIEMRKKGLVSIPATRLRGILPHNPPDLARNHCAAARQAILRDDLASARDYFRTAIVLAKDDPKILQEARKGMTYTDLLINAEAAVTSHAVARAIDLYEEAMVGIGIGEISRLHFYIADKAATCMGNVESQTFNFELNKKIGWRGETALSHWGKNLLEGEVKELSSSDLKGTLQLANDLVSNPPSLDETKNHLKLAIVSGALKIIESSCDEEQRKSFPVIFALHGLFKKCFRFEAYPGTVEKAGEIIDILHENGILRK